MAALTTPTSLAGTAGSAPLVLWSTNPSLKHWIQQRYRGGTHYVWCTPAFAGETLPKYAIGAGQPASSDPASIYRTLHKAVTTGDKGDARIAQWKATLKALAVDWQVSGEISPQDRDEIIAIVEGAALAEFRPLIYAIPYAAIVPNTRIELVDFTKRASREPEYVISDLQDGEFQIIEPWPCNP